MYWLLVSLAYARRRLISSSTRGVARTDRRLPLASMSWPKSSRRAGKAEKFQIHGTRSTEKVTPHRLVPLGQPTAVCLASQALQSTLNLWKWAAIYFYFPA